MQLSSVGKRYRRGPWLFADVSLDIEPGQVVAIGGANGSGKSTLLNLIAGLTRPSVGTISPRPHRIGYVPERFPSMARLSALAYLTHMGRIRGLPTVEAQRAGYALLERFGFFGQPNSALRTLSKGNTQKVALAQALIVPPELLILDEPWTGLDEVGYSVLTDIIAETKARAGVVVLSTHPGIPDPAGDAHRYLLAAGSLSPVAGLPEPAGDPGAGSHVQLRRTSASQELPAAWSCLGSVSAIDNAVMIFTVPVADCDRLLLDGLRHGWSVVTVVPAEQTRPDQSHVAGHDQTPRP